MLGLGGRLGRFRSKNAEVVEKLGWRDIGLRLYRHVVRSRYSSREEQQNLLDSLHYIIFPVEGCSDIQQVSTKRNQRSMLVLTVINSSQ